MSTAATVQGIYTRILQRDPSAAESATWTTLITANNANQAVLINTLINSPEGLNVVAPVIRTYQAVFGRVPDAAGLDFFADALNAGASPNVVAQAFVSSPEFAARYGTAAQSGNVTSAFVQQLYQNILGRGPDAAGLAFWLGANVTPAQMLTQFANSPENVARSASAVSTFLTNAGNGSAVYTGSLFDQVNGGVGGQALTLTLNEDNLVGGVGNDTFSAPFIQNNAGDLKQTLQAVDRIDGGAGVDTLNATLGAGTTILSATNLEVASIRAAGTGAATLDLSAAASVTDVRSVGSVQNLTVLSAAAVNTATLSGSTGGLLVDGTKVSTFTTNATNITNNAPIIVNQATKGFDAHTVNLNASVVAINTAFDDIAVTINATGANKLDGNLLQGGAITKSVTFAGTGSVNVVAAGGIAGTVLATVDAAKLDGGLTALIDTAGGVKSTITGGAGNDVLTLTGIVAGSTISTGGGNDVVKAQAVTTANVVTLGEGNDSYAAGANLLLQTTAGGTIDGGAGTDIINIADGATWTKVSAAAVNNFEVLDVSGGKGIYDVSLKPFATYQADLAIGGAQVAPVTFSNAVTGFTFDVIGNKGVGVAPAGDFTITLKDATPTTDTATINMKAVDGNNDGVVNGVVSAIVTANGIETVTINSTAVLDAATTTTKATTANLYVNAVTLTDDAISTLKFTGDASHSVTVSNTGNTLARVDASAATGNVTFTSLNSTRAMDYIGGNGVDTVVMDKAAGGSFFGGASNDAVKFGVDAFTETLIYKAASEALAVDKGITGTFETAVDTTETATGFVAGVGATTDRVDLSSFAFGGSLRGAVIDRSLTLTDGKIDATEAAGFFTQGVVNRAVAFGTAGGDTFVFVDNNGDGNFGIGTDMVIKLVGTAGFDLANVSF